ncbi:hypothetical protein ACFRFH_00460 [Leifsonia sp. NPDC056824]|uniref:hypothetical protein n=1 Tax=Leifsonia sp. NPDC056824 TaxID=3345953 RepID=UPI0036BEC5A1
MTGGLGSDAYAGDRFWLQRGTALISTSLPELSAQATRLATAVAWFWSLYLAVVAAWSVTSHAVPIVAAIPVITIMIAYLGALYAQFPVAAEFDPRSPEQVKIAYRRMIVVKRGRLFTVYGLLLISAIGIAVVLVLSVGR